MHTYYFTIDTKRPGPNTLAAMHRRGIYIMPKLLTKVVSLGEGIKILAITGTGIASTVNISGRYGKVYKAEMLRKHGANIKVVVKSVNRITTELQKEVTVMSEVVHPNIVRLYGLINEGISVSKLLVIQTTSNKKFGDFARDCVLFINHDYQTTFYTV